MCSPLQTRYNFEGGKNILFPLQVVISKYCRTLFFSREAIFRGRPPLNHARDRMFAVGTFFLL